MFNCFFGAELKPDGVAVNFTVPKGASLVITQCAVTSVVPPPPGSAVPATTQENTTGPSSSTSPISAAAAAAAPTVYSPVTLCVQGHGMPTRFAVCTLSPAQQITYCPLQLIFSKPVAFALVPQTVNTAAAAGPAQLRHVGKKAPREPQGEKTALNRGQANAVYPTVHLTGYYEQAADDDEMDDGGMAMEMMEEYDFFYDDY